MKWKDYKPKPKKDVYEKQINVECPKCGSKIYKRLDIVLTSYPPQHIMDARKESAFEKITKAWNRRIEHE